MNALQGDTEWERCVVLMVSIVQKSFAFGTGVLPSLFHRTAEEEEEIGMAISRGKHRAQ